MQGSRSPFCSPSARVNAFRAGAGARRSWCPSLIMCPVLGSCGPRTRCGQECSEMLVKCAGQESGDQEALRLWGDLS